MKSAALWEKIKDAIRPDRTEPSEYFHVFEDGQMRARQGTRAVRSNALVALQQERLIQFTQSWDDNYSDGYPEYMRAFILTDAGKAEIAPAAPESDAAEPHIISRQVAWICEHCEEMNFTDMPFEHATCTACGKTYSQFHIGSQEGTYEQTLDSDGSADFDAFIPFYPAPEIDEPPDMPEPDDAPAMDDLSDPDVLIDEPVPSKPIAVRVLDLIPRAEYDALKAQLAIVTRSLDEIINLPENDFLAAWSIAVAARKKLPGYFPEHEPTMIDVMMNPVAGESLED